MRNSLEKVSSFLFFFHLLVVKRFEKSFELFLHHLCFTYHIDYFFYYLSFLYCLVALFLRSDFSDILCNNFLIQRVNILCCFSQNW